MSKDDSEFVNSALDHLEILESHLNHPDGMNQILFDAACMRLSAAIEVLSKTSPEFRELTFGDQWHEMWATRNRIAHGYGRLDFHIMQATLFSETPQLLAKLRN